MVSPLRIYFASPFLPIIVPVIEQCIYLLCQFRLLRIIRVFRSLYDRFGFRVVRRRGTCDRYRIRDQLPHLLSCKSRLRSIRLDVILLVRGRPDCIR